MQRNPTVFAILLALSAAPTLAGAKIDPALTDFARGKAKAPTALVLAVLAPPAQETAPMPERYDTQGVLRYLRARAKASWSSVEQRLRDAGSLETTVKLVRLHWINNSFLGRVTPEGLKSLARTDGIRKIYANRRISFEPPKRHRRLTDAGNDPYDYAEIGLDKLIAEAPQITGKGVVVGSVDTGVDGKHPALDGKVLVFFDANQKKTTDPVDSDSHGTHTNGTILGGDRGEIRIGMAPDARLVAAGPLSDFDAMLRAMEFMLHPEGAPVPRAVNNSWNCQGAPDIELFYKAISAWEAAGVLPVFSAGNAGPGTGSITPPHEHPGVIAIGATGRNGKITSFSSRGPGKYKGEETQKPDITAPGEGIYSSVPGGRYEEMSGTSMAAPHVTGSVALILQLAPELNPTQIRKLLVHTADPVGEDDQPGKAGEWNKAYGFGKLNVYRAAKAAKDVQERLARLGALDLMTTVLTSPLDVKIQDILEKPAPLTARDFDFPESLEGDTWR